MDGNNDMWDDSALIKAYDDAIRGYMEAHDPDKKGSKPKNKKEKEKDAPSVMQTETEVPNSEHQIGVTGDTQHDSNTRTQRTEEGEDWSPFGGNTNNTNHNHLPTNAHQYQPHQYQQQHHYQPTPYLSAQLPHTQFPMAPSCSPNPLLPPYYPHFSSLYSQQPFHSHGPPCPVHSPPHFLAPPPLHPPPPLSAIRGAGLAQGDDELAELVL